MCKQRFNYEKDGLNEYERSGFHLKNGRNHIDTRRLIRIGYRDKFPEELFSKARNTHYFVPKYKTRYEYAVNRLLDTVERLSRDWNVEYRDAINGLKTAKQVRDETYLNGISGTVYSEDLEEANDNALIEEMKRGFKWGEIVKSIHLQYIQKIYIDYFRSIILVLEGKGHSIGDDFDLGDLTEYAQNQLKSPKNKNPLASLPHYKYFDLLRCINNFLKHNTVHAYSCLADASTKYTDENHKQFLASFVLSEKEARRKYRTGMYAGNWLKIDGNYVDNTLGNLREFSKELCRLLYKEDPNEASWNYDDYLVNQLKMAMTEI